ncbi:MAG: hypothetical protein M3126_08720 [Candidatus Eremiobacteraeota bacterium]|nr:hypothetical protein [Candidatus Eremiobacteraeota bacterium]
MITHATAIVALLAGTVGAQPGIYALANGKAQITSSLSSRTTRGGTAIDIVQRDARSSATILHYHRDQTKLMHLVIVSDDFEGFSHVHPVLGADGHFTIVTPLSTARSYIVYADTTPEGLGKQVFRFRIGGAIAPAASSRPTAKASAQGYDVQLSSDRIDAARGASITATIRHGGSIASNLHPYLGAVAHAVFINIRTLTYEHVHPMQPGSSDRATNMPGMPMENMHRESNLAAGATLKGKMTLAIPALAPGTYRMWLQFRAGSALIVAPFTIIAV